MSDSLLLSNDEIIEISNCFSNEGIIAWLNLNNIEYLIGADKLPKVVRSTFNKTFNKKNNKYPFELNQRQSFDRRCCGIYFLKLDKELVYIGKTKTFFVRMAAHDKSGIEWDEVVFHPVDMKDLNLVEKELIYRYKPPLNINNKYQSSSSNAKYPRAVIDSQSL